MSHPAILHLPAPKLFLRLAPTLAPVLELVPLLMGQQLADDLVEMLFALPELLTEPVDQFRLTTPPSPLARRRSPIASSALSRAGRVADIVESHAAR